MIDPSADPELDELVAREKLLLCCAQMQRSQIPILLLDTFITWLAARGGFLSLGLVWLALSAAFQVARSAHARNLLKNPPPVASAAATRLGRVFLVGGVLRALIFPVVFLSPLGELHYLLTMMTIGSAAGGVGVVAGLLRAYLMWSVPVCATLATSWLAQGTFEGAGVAVLLVLLFTMLSLFVRDQARSMRELQKSLREQQESTRQLAVLSTSLEHERDRAEAASRAKTRFFASASHDLRQPLQALAYDATTLDLLAQTSGNEQLGGLSHRMQRALQQCSGLLDGLLDISLLDADKVKANLVPVDLVPLLQSLRDEFTPLAAERGLTIRVQASQDDGWPWARTDADQLLRVLRNLVINAVKFTERGGITLTAVAEAPVPPGAPRWVVIRVVDTGPGIPETEHAKIFEEFYQTGNAARDRTKGLGLGLAIVRRTANLLGVQVQLHSQVGAGSTFELRIPALDIADVPPTSPGPTHVARETPLEPLSILVVDDEHEGVESLDAYLRVLGWQVRSAAGSAGATQIIDEGFAPDVLLVDYRLRGETGLEVIERVRERRPVMPVVILTGDTAPERLREILSIGIKVVHKPVYGDHLSRALIDAARGGAE